MSTSIGIVAYLALFAGVGVVFLFVNLLVGKLVRPGGYSPDDLIVGLSDTLADPDAAIESFHCYTFNQVETTEAWRKDMLESLG